MAKIFDVLKQFNEKIEVNRKLRAEKEKDLKQRIGEREKKIEALRTALEKINIQIEGNETVLKGIMTDKAAEFDRLIQAREGLKADHKSGKIGLDVFLAQNKKDHEIEAMAHEKFSDKIHVARLAANEVSKEKLRIMAEIEEQNFWISIAVNEFWKKFVEILDRETQSFKKHLSVGGGSGTHREDFEVSKGGISGKRWEPKSWDELNEIITSGLIQEKHYGEYDFFMQDLRAAGIDFDSQKIVMSYYPTGNMLSPEGFSVSVYHKFKNEIIQVPTKRPDKTDQEALERLTGRQS